jgi:hypothetical protein
MHFGPEPFILKIQNLIFESFKMFWKNIFLEVMMYTTGI